MGEDRKTDIATMRAYMVALHQESEEWYARKLITRAEGGWTNVPGALKILATWYHSEREGKWIKQECQDTWSTLSPEELVAVHGKLIKRHPDRPNMLFYVSDALKIAYEIQEVQP